MVDSTTSPIQSKTNAEVELEEIRYGNRVFSGSSAPALHEHPINKDLYRALQKQGRQCVLGDC